jgi:hypothetical protein
VDAVESQRIFRRYRFRPVHPSGGSFWGTLPWLSSEGLSSQFPRELNFKSLVTVDRSLYRKMTGGPPEFSGAQFTQSPVNRPISARFFLFGSYVFLASLRISVRRFTSRLSRRCCSLLTRPRPAPGPQSAGCEALPLNKTPTERKYTFSLPASMAGVSLLGDWPVIFLIAEIEDLYSHE